METLKAYANAQAAKGQEQKVFDWNKAAQPIKDRQPGYVEAGLNGDWEYTGGCIYKNGAIVEDESTYLSSNWATPMIELDGDLIECYVMQSQALSWNAATKWPSEAIALLNS